jgi:hypothetical protein
VVFYNTGCGRKPQNQCSIRLLAPIDNGKSFISLLISNALVSPGNEVCKRYANLSWRRTAKYPPRDRATSATFCRYKLLSTSLDCGEVEKTSMEFLPGRYRILARLELALTSLPLDGHLNGLLNERTR